MLWDVHSEETVKRMDSNTIPATVELIKWHHIYDMLQFFLTESPATGTLGTMADMSANAV